MDSHQHDSGSSSEGFCENETLALEKPLALPHPSSRLASVSASTALLSSISSNSAPANPPPQPPPSLPLPSSTSSAHPISGLDLPPSSPSTNVSNVSTGAGVPSSTSVVDDNAKDSPSGGSLGFGLSPQPPVDPTSTTSYDESDSPSGEKPSTQSPALAGVSGDRHHLKGVLSDKKVSTPSVDELDSDWSDYPGNGELHF